MLLDTFFFVLFDPVLFILLNTNNIMLLFDHHSYHLASWIPHASSPGFFFLKKKGLLFMRIIISFSPLLKFSLLPCPNEMAFNFYLLFADMAGAAPEGSQFDARQYDARMNELYCLLLTILGFCFTLGSFALCMNSCIFVIIITSYNVFLL